MALVLPEGITTTKTRKLGNTKKKKNIIFFRDKSTISNNAVSCFNNFVLSW
jgi:hypothetical protein